jgi:hypothetical protein
MIQAHAGHAAMVEWVGGRLDPEHFDVFVANDRLPRKRAPRRREQRAVGLASVPANPPIERPSTPTSGPRVVG